jgi:hypothetical protein
MVQNITIGIYSLRCPEGPCSMDAGKTWHRNSHSQTSRPCLTHLDKAGANG